MDPDICRLNTRERAVLNKLDDQDLNEMLRRAGLKKQYDRQKGLGAKVERQYETGDLETHYTKTYKGHYNYPQRASRRPLLTPRDPNPPKGDFVTQSAVDFIPRPVHPIELVKKSDTYRPLSAKVDGTTKYMEDFPAKSIEASQSLKPAAQTAMSRIKAKFDGRTMHKEHYKSWVARESDWKFKFEELPPVVDNIIFPKGDPLSNVTETRQQFPGKYAPKPEQAKIAQPTVKLCVEGDFDHVTVNKNTYQNTVGKEQKSFNYKPKVKMPTEGRQPFYGETKYMHDYKSKDTAAAVRGPMLPQPNNIAVDKEAKGIYDTWQKDFKGYDVRKHKRPAEIRYDISEYVPPTEKVEGMTVTMDAFTPKNLSLAYNPPKRQVIQERGTIPKFESKTMNDEFYKEWPVQPRDRFGDFKEHVAQIPYQGEFYGVTTTGRVFTPKKWEKTEPFIPEEKPVKTDGSHDFNTVHRTTYIKPAYKLDAEEYGILESALLKVAKQGSLQKALNCCTSRQSVQATA